MQSCTMIIILFSILHIGEIVAVLITLGTVIMVLCLALVGTLSVLLTIIIRYKKGIHRQCIEFYSPLGCTCSYMFYNCQCVHYILCTNFDHPGRINRMNPDTRYRDLQLECLLVTIFKFYRTEDRTKGSIPGSGILTPNVSYELTNISQKRRVSQGNVELERNPAYAITASPRVCQQQHILI